MPVQKEQRTNTRVQFEMTDQEFKIFESLEKMTGSKTHKDLLDNALTLLEWAVEQRLQQRLVVSFDPANKTYRELTMPALRHAASLQQRQKEEASA
jgi:hypothetical protein